MRVPVQRQAVASLLTACLLSLGSWLASASTHWVVTEDGRIQSQVYNFLMSQVKNIYVLVNNKTSLYQKSVHRKRRV